MKVGELVRTIRWVQGLVGQVPRDRFGIIVEVPPPDDYWGVTAVVQWMDGLSEEVMEENLEVINESR